VRLQAPESPAEIWLKLECLQPIGSFKIRGAANAIRSAPPGAIAGGVLTITGVADPGHDPTSSGVFARLTFETDCCTWSEPAGLVLSGATGDFTTLRLIGRELVCRYAPDGDVNDDGSVTLADAQCALETYMYAPYLPPSGCGGPGAAMRADVDCSDAPTPFAGPLLGSGIWTGVRGSGAPRPGLGSEGRCSATVISRLTNSLHAAAKARSMRVT